MRDTVADIGHSGFTTNQPKGVSLYATEATVPLFGGTMMELEQLSDEEGNISVELWDTEALPSDSGINLKQEVWMCGCLIGKVFGRVYCVFMLKLFFSC